MGVAGGFAGRTLDYNMDSQNPADPDIGSDSDDDSRFYEYPDMVSMNERGEKMVKLLDSDFWNGISHLDFGQHFDEDDLE